ncbi:MAG: sigma-70 family RNA polymerase sigma factor [Alphaproteobacteria bacterium]|nr:sigma-70 family RNA polymerase sigma factor [Alphaproteobacteria bacterium]
MHRLIVEQIPHLRRYSGALLRDREKADDLVQDCLTRAMDRLHLWTPGTNMRAWLFTILHNLHVNAARRLSRQPGQVGLDETHEDLRSAPPEQGAGLALRDMDRALGKLPDDQRQVILLIGLEDLSYADAADVLDVPIGTVMSRLNRGREKLREIMENEDTPTIRRVK